MAFRVQRSDDEGSAFWGLIRAPGSAVGLGVVT